MIILLWILGILTTIYIVGFVCFLWSILKESGCKNLKFGLISSSIWPILKILDHIRSPRK